MLTDEDNNLNVIERSDPPKYVQSLIWMKRIKLDAIFRNAVPNPCKDKDVCCDKLEEKKDTNVLR